MEHATTPAGGRVPADRALLAAGAKHAAAAVEGLSQPAAAIDAAVGALHEAVGGVLPSVFVLEHGRLWLVAQRGYAVVPDGIRIERGVMGRAVRLGVPQHAPDVRSDPDYVGALPGIGSELALPLRVGQLVVGALNIESELVLPEDAAELLEPLIAELSPLTEALRKSRKLDLPALARLFVHLGSLRDPDEIAGIAAASLSKVLPVESTQVVVWNERGAPVELASWRSDDAGRGLLGLAELDAARTLVDPTVVCQLLDLAGRHGDTGPALVWLPLRANGVEIGALVAASLSDEHVDPVDLDTAAVLAAHVAASLDAAFAFQREHRSAVTDSLTGVLNRRGLEERLDYEVSVAQARRLPLSLLVIDCDDFKEINDRAGHEFGDSLLREVAHFLERAVPPGAAAARLGGDEFVVMLPRAGADDAADLGGEIRRTLADGLTDAGYPLRISAGISTYPFDGATATALLRAADQALYSAKDAGKDRVASFRDVLRPDAVFEAPLGRAADARRRARAEGSVLAEIVSAAAAIDREDTAEGVCNRLCKALVFAVGVTACSVSTVVGEHLVGVSRHSLRDVGLGDDAAYRIADFPLTRETLRTGEPHGVSFLDADVEPAVAFVLREFGMNATLMLPLCPDGEPWGLVELYEMRLRRFTGDELVVAQFLTTHAERRLAVVGTRMPLRPLPPVYELPAASDTEEPGLEPWGPRTR
jgi:diguanylate cyclase (GGDEF)-like protein